MDKWVEKFECLARGDLVGAAAISITGALKGKSAEDLLGIDDEAAEEEGDAYHAPNGSSKGYGKEGYEPSAAAAAGGGSRRPQQLPTTCHVQEARRTAVAEFFKRMPPTRCDNCSAQNPKIKKQGYSKIFQEYSRKQVLTNYARGIMSLAGAVRVKGAAGAAAAAAAEAVMPEAAVGQKRKREAGAAAAAAEGGGSKARIKAEPDVVSLVQEDVRISPQRKKQGHE
jgi:hypothetical protein